MSLQSDIQRNIIVLLSAGALCSPLCAQEVQISASTGDALALFDRGRDAFHRTWFEEADDLLAEAIAVDPNLAIAQAYKATAETFLYFDAADRMIRALELADDASPGERLMVAALAAFVDGDYESAALTLREIGSLFPDDRWARHALGFTLVDLGSPEQAIPILTRLIEDHPGFSAPWNHLGYAYLDIGESSFAEQAMASFRPRKPSSTPLRRATPLTSNAPWHQLWRRRSSPPTGSYPTTDPRHPRTRSQETIRTMGQSRSEF
jgi:Flp pilus assembly protein TadD